MTVNFSRKDFDRAQGKLASIQEKIKRVQKKGEEITHRVVRTIEVSGSAFIGGVVQGKTGGVEVIGVPLDLALGLGLNALGYLGAAGKASDHLVNLGDGQLACFATTMGRGVGATWKAKGLGKGATTAGGLRGTRSAGSIEGGEGLTDKEIAAATEEAIRRT